MTEHKWHAVYCTDCGMALGYSPHEPPKHVEVYCVHCSHSHAEVASWMMPVGSDYSTNGLYGVQKNSSGAIRLSMQFRKTWNKLFAKLEQHRIAKCDTKRLGK